MALKALLDACVLYPTVMREMLLGAAQLGHFTPLWSPRILEEWRRAAERHGPVAAMQARSDAACAMAAFPDASVPGRVKDEQRLYLPDENDIHVLASAIAGSADVIVTLNAKDFPRATLADEGLKRTDPDALLMELWLVDEAGITALSQSVFDTAIQSGEALSTPAIMLKAARLPRLAKVMR